MDIRLTQLVEGKWPNVGSQALRVHGGTSTDIGTGEIMFKTSVPDNWSSCWTLSNIDKIDER